jgi:hypothetical protein
MVSGQGFNLLFLVMTNFVDNLHLHIEEVKKAVANQK